MFGMILYPYNPLVFDMNGDGIQLTSLTGSNVYFDLDSDGFAERTGWVSASDGLLVRDNNGDGFINNGSELFGTSSRNGFEVPRALHSNGDNQITRADTEYGSLRIWRDANSDGVAKQRYTRPHGCGNTNIAANDNEQLHDFRITR